ncbi:thioredoxin family protein [Eisenibacter elegans]|jgi:thiol-disulfide isomerase/thioredoxin|uniref:thioredoxin family protein n=1 Tax=Eisenibacter elegans TaxID=997 RepID=UPI00041C2542|nr:thioredoxin family protein [Eisenibacter elegans]
MSVIVATDADFKQHLQDQGLIIVKYYADWCGGCKLFAPKYRRLSGDERFEGISFLDVNAELNPEARQLAGVDNLPYFAIFRNGQLVEGTSTAKEDTVVAMLQKLQEVENPA